MDKRYACYCGICCENCAVKVKIEPLSKALYDEMEKAGFGEIVHTIPGGGGFWPFLKSMAEDGICDSCREGSGYPDCETRICAEEKGVEMCALCGDYPCDNFDTFFEKYPMLKSDNAALRDEGMEAWLKIQDERKKKGFTYTDATLSGNNPA